MTSVLSGPLYFDNHVLLTALDGLDLAEVEDRVRRRLKDTDIELAAVGDIEQGGVHDLLDLLKNAFPGRLSEEQRLARSRYYPPLRRSLGLWSQASANKGEEQYATVRAYEGPSIGGREMAALMILHRVLNKEVEERNRFEKKLGYINHSFYKPFNRRYYYFFVGSTDGLNNVQEIEKGWELALKKLADDRFTKSDLEQARRAHLLDEQIAAIEPEQDLARLRSDMYYSGNPQNSELRAKLISEVSIEEIKDVGRKYLLDKPSINVMVSREPVTEISGCEKTYSSPSELRQALSL